MRIPIGYVILIHIIGGLIIFGIVYNFGVDMFNMFNIDFYAGSPLSASLPADQIETQDILFAAVKYFIVTALIADTLYVLTESQR